MCRFGVLPRDTDGAGCDFRRGYCRAGKWWDATMRERLWIQRSEEPSEHTGTQRADASTRFHQCERTPSGHLARDCTAGGIWRWRRVRFRRSRHHRAPGTHETQKRPARIGPVRPDRSHPRCGAPLDVETRTQMEGAFGHRFADVRVHTGAAANALSRDIGATPSQRGVISFFATAHTAPARVNRGCWRMN